jgi:hypothetical protein
MTIRFYCAILGNCGGASWRVAFTCEAFSKRQRGLSTSTPFCIARASSRSERVLLYYSAVGGGWFSMTALLSLPLVGRGGSFDIPDA